MKRVASLAFVCTVLMTACSAVPGGVGGTESSSGSPPARLLPRSWALAVPGVSPVAVNSGRVFFAAGSQMRAVTLDDGNAIWTTDIADLNPTPYAVSLGRPVWQYGYLDAAVSGAGFGGSYRFDAATGAVTGNVAFHQFQGDLTVDGPLSARVIGQYGSNTPIVTALHFGSMYLLNIGGSFPTGPITITGARAFAVSGDWVLGFDSHQQCTPTSPPQFCRPDWATMVSGAYGMVSNAGSGKIAVATVLGTIELLDATSGAKVASTAPAAVATSPPAHSGLGYFYTVGADGVLRAYSTELCTAGACVPVWTAAVAAASSVAPTVNSGRVFVATDDGRLSAFHARGCGAVSCAPIATGDSGTGMRPMSKPIVSEGHVVLQYVNEVVVFDGV